MGQRHVVGLPGGQAGRAQMLQQFALAQCGRWVRDRDEENRKALMRWAKLAVMSALYSSSLGAMRATQASNSSLAHSASISSPWVTLIQASPRALRGP